MRTWSSAVENHTKLVEAARKNLADARAKHASAHTASVIGRIDGVEAGVRPVGPGRTTITAAGGVAGLIFGLGVVFLFASPVPVMEPRRAEVKPQAGHAGRRKRRQDADRAVRIVPRDDAGRSDSAGRKTRRPAGEIAGSLTEHDLDLRRRPRGRLPLF